MDFIKWPGLLTKCNIYTSKYIYINYLSQAFDFFFSALLSIGTIQAQRASSLFTGKHCLQVWMRSRYTDIDGGSDRNEHRQANCIFKRGIIISQTAITTQFIATVLGISVLDVPWLKLSPCFFYCNFYVFISQQYS